jgi:hypothetical protein
MNLNSNLGQDLAHIGYNKNGFDPSFIFLPQPTIFQTNISSKWKMKE